MIGTPRIGVGVLWCCIGLAWILAALEEDAVMRILLGIGWLAFGVFCSVVAVRDRKHKRGFYRMAAPVPEFRVWADDQQDAPR
jgi:hypothetical protein